MSGTAAVATQEEGCLYSQDTTVSGSGTNNNRRVSFRSSLVTCTSYRPSTTKDEKALLYYTRQQYEIMALESYYEQQQEEAMKMKLFSWEDFMVCKSSYDDSMNSLSDCDSAEVVLHINSSQDQEVRAVEGGNDIHIMHKVQTLCDLHT